MTAEKRPLFVVVDLTNILREMVEAVPNGRGGWLFPGVDLTRLDLLDAEIHKRWPHALTYLVADRSGRYDFVVGHKDLERYKALLDQRVVQQEAHADEPCCEFARHYGGYVVTNDGYGSHRDEFPDVIPARLIKCSFIGTATCRLAAPEDLQPIVAEHNPRDIARETRAPRTTRGDASITNPTPAAVSPPDGGDSQGRHFGSVTSAVHSPQSDAAYQVPRGDRDHTRVAQKGGPISHRGPNPLIVILAIAAVFLAAQAARGFFGSSIDSALAMTLNAALTAVAVWLVARYRFHILTGAFFIGAVVAATTCFWWSRTLGGSLGGISLLVGLVAASAVLVTARLMVKKEAPGLGIDWAKAAGGIALAAVGFSLAFGLGAFRSQDGVFTLGHLPSPAARSPLPASQAAAVAGAYEQAMVDIGQLLSGGEAVERVYESCSPEIKGSMTAGDFRTSVEQYSLVKGKTVSVAPRVSQAVAENGNTGVRIPFTVHPSSGSARGIELTYTWDGRRWRLARLRPAE